jgi:hypothetical protein
MSSLMKGTGYIILTIAILLGIAIVVAFLALDVLVVFNPNTQEATDVLGRRVEPMPSWVKAINPFERDTWPGWKWFFIDLVIGAVAMMLVYGIGALGLLLVEGGRSRSPSDNTPARKPPSMEDRWRKEGFSDEEIAILKTGDQQKSAQVYSDRLNKGRG